ncbi:Uncharacterised protein [Mycobacteroides abscessus subsp. massiliense]|nr:Uncharacterised protein [Mycobacteroides abscessus subsp. massiliense]
MLEAVQCGADQRGDDGERCDGDQQIQRHLALGLGGGGGEEECVGKGYRHRGVHREIGHHRIREGSEARLVGAVRGGGLLEQPVHPGAHLAAAHRGNPGDRQFLRVVLFGRGPAAHPLATLLAERG